PTAITLVIGGAPQLAAFAICIRLLVEGMLPLAIDWQQMLALMAIGSLLVGNLAAVAQSNLKRMLAFSTISQMGFLLLGGPGETKASVAESLAFADSLRLEAVKVTVGIRIYPGTKLAEIAVQDGLVSPADNLLMPRFYVVRDIKDWLQETVKNLAAADPRWITGSEELQN
ncbi:MAG TPA: proton-conducting transporter membrane subunit, partial [Syntrophales bacterium]|nr:proton-conducting transporter membrane subunit [Syntrophales bacterium]